MKRVLVLIANDNYGGATQVVADQLNNALAVAYEIGVITDSILHKKIRSTSARHIIRTSKSRWVVKVYFTLWAIIFGGCRNVHTHGRGAGMIMLLCFFISRILFIDMKWVHTVHGYHTKNERSRTKRFCYKVIERLVFRRVARVVSVSQSEKMDILEDGNDISNKIVLIPNSVPEPNRHCTGLPNYLEKIRNGYQYILINVCRFHDQKNLDRWLSIASLNKDMLHVLVGDGPRFVEYNKISGNCPNIYLTGFCEEPRDWIEHCDGYFSTSLWEGNPISVLDACSYDLKLILSNVVGHTDLEYGSLFFDLSSDDAAIVKKIKDFMRQGHSGSSKQNILNQRDWILRIESCFD